MKVLLKGESSRKETIIDADAGIVTCHAASSHPSLDKGAKFQAEWKFDFNGVSQSQILRAAAEYCLIAKRREFVKIGKPKDKEWDGVLFETLGLIPTPQSKSAKLLKTLAGFSPEELEEMGIVLTAE